MVTTKADVFEFLNDFNDLIKKPYDSTEFVQSVQAMFNDITKDKAEKFVKSWQSYMSEYNT